MGAHQEQLIFFLAAPSHLGKDQISHSIGAGAMARKKSAATVPIRSKLTEHFKELVLSELVTARRTFPVTARVDLQRSLEQLFDKKFQSEPIGIYREYNHGTMKFSDLIESRRNPASVGPLRHDEVDIGNETAERCLHDALWLTK